MSSITGGSSTMERYRKHPKGYDFQLGIFRAATLAAIICGEESMFIPCRNLKICNSRVSFLFFKPKWVSNSRRRKIRFQRWENPIQKRQERDLEFNDQVQGQEDPKGWGETRTSDEDMSGICEKGHFRKIKLMYCLRGLTTGRFV